MLDSICRSLATNGHNVLVDYEVEIGEEWFRKLTEWMAECDVALILFSKAALNDSQWVRAESAILTWRKRMQPGFQLVGVLLDDVKAEELDQQAFYKAIRISDFQMLRDCRESDEIVKKLNEHFAKSGPREKSPFEKLSSEFERALGTIDETYLQEAWRALEGNNKPHWQPGMNFADSLARLMFCAPEKSLDNFRILIEKLAFPLDKNKALKMLQMIKGLWVDGAAADTLAWIRTQKRAAMINGARIGEFTGHCYARRAWPFPKNYKLIEAGSSRSWKEISDILYKEFALSGSIADGQRRLPMYEDPVFLVFPHSSESDSAQCMDPFPDEDLIATIVAAHQNVTPIVSTGSRLPGHIHYLEAVLPEIKVDRETDQETNQETKQFDLHDKLIDYINAWI